MNKRIQDILDKAYNGQEEVETYYCTYKKEFIIDATVLGEKMVIDFYLKDLEVVGIKRFTFIKTVKAETVQKAIAYHYNYTLRLKYAGKNVPCNIPMNIIAN